MCVCAGDNTYREVCNESVHKEDIELSLEMDYHTTPEGLSSTEDSPLGLPRMFKVVLSIGFGRSKFMLVTGKLIAKN